MENPLIGIALTLVLSGAAVTAADARLESPNGNLVVTFDVRDFAGVRT